MYHLHSDTHCDIRVSPQTGGPHSTHRVENNGLHRVWMPGLKFHSCHLPLLVCFNVEASVSSIAKLRGKQDLSYRGGLN